MAARLKRDRYRWLLTGQWVVLSIGLGGLMGGLFFSLITLANAHHQSDTDFAIGCVLGGTGWAIAFACLGWWGLTRLAYASRTTRYDPNNRAEFEARIEVARERAMLVEDRVEGPSNRAAQRTASPPPLPRFRANKET
jgi:hypothetical protein